MTPRRFLADPRPPQGSFADTQALEDEPPAPLPPATLSVLRQALAALTPKQREAVELHFFEGLSQGAIARRLGISQQVIQKRLHGVQRRGRRIGGALPRLRSVLSGAASGALTSATSGALAGLPSPSVRP